MGIQFDWQFDERPDDLLPQPAEHGGRRGILLLGLLLVAVLLVGGGRFLISERQLRVQTQQIIDLQRSAYQAGDGELFFAQLEQNPAFRFAQLTPLARMLFEGEPVISRAQLRDDTIWASVRFTHGGQRLQRLVFYRRTDDGVRQVAADMRFWGALEERSTVWGSITYRRADRPFVEPVESALQAQFEQAGVAVHDLAVVLRSEDLLYQGPNTLYLPSPRLVGLTADGSAAEIYWQLLQQRTRDFLSGHGRPLTLHFAAPQENVTYLQRLAAQYDEAVIEIVPLESLPAAAEEMLRQVDGAYWLPTSAALAAGHVVDLTPFAASDQRFAAADFYNSAWQGASWRSRMWLAPVATQMRLLYYDRQSWEAPTALWTWQELQLQTAEVADASGRQGFMSEFLDPVYAYAFSHSGPQQLDSAAAAAALQWYADFEPLLDLSSRSDGEQRHLTSLSALSSRRQVDLWVGDPSEFEYHFLLSPIGVAPFPADEQMRTVTPLTVVGGVISAYSETPSAVWRWLSWLSNQPPEPFRRQIPARPSVAQRTGYWQSLPAPLNNVMRTAFATSRPITIADRDLLSWEKLRQVRVEGAAASEVARPARLKWFDAE